MRVAKRQTASEVKASNEVRATAKMQEQARCKKEDHVDHLARFTRILHDHLEKTRWIMLIILRKIRGCWAILQRRSRKVVDHLAGSTDAALAGSLDLESCLKLTDQGVLPLGSMKTLGALSFPPTDLISDEPVKQLKNDLPNCTFKLHLGRIRTKK